MTADPRRPPPRPPRRLGSAARARLAALPEPARPFAAAVVEQTAHPLGGGEAPPAHEEHRMDQVMRLLAAGGEAIVDAAGAAAMLASDAALLSAVFGNVDLLFVHGHPDADGVALLVMRAMEGLEDADG